MKLQYIAALVAAATTAAEAKPSPVVDRGPSLEKAQVGNVRIRDLGGGYFESGSSQFSVQGLEELQGLLKERGYNEDGHYLVIVDLRQESHGFVDGHAIRWMEPEDRVQLEYDWINLGKSHEQVIDAETNLLATLQGSKPVYSTYEKDVENGKEVHKLFPFNGLVTADKTMSERELVERELGAGHYIRLTIPDHKKAESDKEIDLFLAELDRVLDAAGKKGQKPWLHFHCAAGQGRTTTFMALYDLYIHLSKLSPETIAYWAPNTPLDQSFEVFNLHLRAQKDNNDKKTTHVNKSDKGGADISYDGAVAARKKDELKGAAALDRFRFIANFSWYVVMRALEDEPKAYKRWSEWAKGYGCALDDFANPNGNGSYPYCQIAKK